jgi:hypothetical protein
VEDYLLTLVGPGDEVVIKGHRISKHGHLDVGANELVTVSVDGEGHS